MGLTRIKADQISNIDYKQAVRVITLSNITLSGGAPTVVDGVTLVLADRVLVAGQSTASQNGLYYVTTLGTGSDGTWSRTIDADATGEVAAGMIVMVTEGTTYKDSQWKLTTNNPIVVGTTALTFEQNSAFAFGNVYANGTAVVATTVGDTLTLTAGTNIQITGNISAKSVTIGVTGLSLNSISNGTSNVNVVSSGGNVTVGVGGTSNVAVFSSTGANITGTLGVTGNITGGNLQGTSIVGTLTTAAQTNITSVGTLGSLAVTGNITSGNLSGTSIVGTLTTAAQTNITSVGTLGSLAVTGNITSGNVQGTAHTGTTGTFTGNVTTGNVSGTTGAFTNVGGTLTTAAQPNITSVGTLTSLAVTGNITSGNVQGTTHSGTTGTFTGNVTGGNLITAGVVSATGNISTSNYYIGNGAYLTGISVAAAGNTITNGNSNVYVYPDGNVTVSIAGSGNVTETSVGQLYINGLITTPKTLTLSTTLPANTNSVVISPLIIANGSIITVPSSSTLYVQSF